MLKHSISVKNENCFVTKYNLLSLQILVSFSQLSSRYSRVFRHRKHNSGKNKNVKAQESSVAVYDAIVCQESLEEAIKNFDKNVLRYV